MSSRIHHAGLAQKVMSGADAAAMIHHGDNVGFSGFTGAGYPKDVPRALAGRIKAAHDRGEEFRIGVWTGASTAPELDGALAEVDGISTRVPYQSDPVTRAKINSGDIDYVDIHLSHLNQYVEHGFMGRLDFAVVEVTAITPGGRLVPSASVGCNRTYLDKADKIILEVNAWQPAEIEGVHDIWRNETIPNRHPVPILHPGDRIGTPTSKSTRARSSPSSRPTPPTATRRSSRSTTRRGPSRRTSSTSSSTRSRRAGCPRSCSRCSPASATSPTPSSTGCTPRRGPARVSGPTPRCSRTACST
ncbi:hypothetical protein [Arsenicicoccus piscis]|uniref:Acetyl-CoA hydrolase/transferase N-terminal domain-containing protein n=1 Tax=Arsenicicoccus piscis TaxID=673954 RepID=A0ABQ6HT62_9MICO|nr:hypothetical protein GCM10025862_27660 [Arsenicicoccus piscis]